MADPVAGATIRDAVALGTLSAAAAAPTNSTSTAYEASRVVAAVPATLYGFSVYNSKAGSQFILLFDAQRLPAEAAIPVLVIPIAATTLTTVDFGVFGRRFDAGIVIANSSTGPTKTIGSADCWFDVQYR